MTYRTLSSVLLAVLLSFGAVGCTDTGVSPESTATAENTFTDANSLRSFLAKLYAGLALTGQVGPAGAGDIQGIDDEGFSSYTRLWWQMQELPTDEAVIAWSDVGVQELNTQGWSSDNPFNSGMYSRVFFQAAQVNEFLRQTTDAQLDAKGIRSGRRDDIAQWRAEARFLRALSYWHAIDLFGAVPLVTEDDPVGTGEGESAPEMSTADSLFAFVESELRDISDTEGDETLPPAGAAEYGRADKGAAWMVLSKMFLNAEVYIGESRYDDAVAFSNRIIDAYGATEDALESDYHDLFLADNHTAKGIIFPVPQDGENSQNFGNTTFLVNASTGGSVTPDSFGVPGGGWLGLRATPTLVDRFESNDTRPVFENMPGETQFFQQGRTKELQTITEFSQGYAVPKYQNMTSEGEMGQDDQFPDTDYPMFRLAEAYLTYAEAKLRGGAGGDIDPLNLVNLLRDRAGADEVSSLSLDFILEERSRELFWEGTRRTDLRRFGLFTGGEFVWPFKGGSNNVTGGSTQDFLGLYPIPSSEILANPNLTQDDQNPGY